MNKNNIYKRIAYNQIITFYDQIQFQIMVISTRFIMNETNCIFDKLSISTILNNEKYLYQYFKQRFL